MPNVGIFYFSLATFQCLKLHVMTNFLSLLQYSSKCEETSPNLRFPETRQQKDCRKFSTLSIHFGDDIKRGNMVILYRATLLE